ncbi:MAG: hypothetical protein K2P70_05010 [Hyphomonadaceae bacterium]|nr:hypothetical protein [Hyphomonadaceae bacterium]
MSFYWAEASQGSRKFTVLLEQGAPVVALSSTIPEYFNLHFIDDSDFIDATWRTQAPFTPLRATDLAVPQSNADREFLVGLSAKHERDLKHWKPATVGDVIFNWWD